MKKLIGSLIALIRSPKRPTVEPAAVLDVEALLAPAGAAYQQGRLDEAVLLLQSLLDKHHHLAEAHLLHGAILHEQRQYEDARDCYVLAGCIKPDWWQVEYRFGLLAAAEGRIQEAITALTKALALGANDARVHNDLGAVYLRQARLDEAIHHFRTAVALQPELLAAHSNLGYALFRHKEVYDEGLAHIERALDLDASNIPALCNLSMALQYGGKLEEAMAICDELLVRDANLHEARTNRALMRLSKGEFRTGWQEYEARKHAPEYDPTEKLPWPPWDGSEASGKTILVYAEQGLGDEIMFASCLPELIQRAGLCIVECHPKLERLFSRSFPLAAIVKKDNWESSQVFNEKPPAFKVAIGSLPRFMRNTLEEFPRNAGYLRADSDRVVFWRRQLTALPGRVKLGISWRGGLAPTRRSLRSIPLTQWLPILRVPHVDFISLQYTHCAHELDTLREQHGVEIHQWRQAIEDYDETSALVTALDGVISVQTAVVHLAGALGKAVWTFIPAVAEWRYGTHGETMPWYPTVRLIRQMTPGDWQPAMRSMRAILVSLAAKNPQVEPSEVTKIVS